MRPSELLGRRSLERDLAALADGSLARERRRRVERALAASPALRACLLEQQRAVRAVRTVRRERAPMALRAVLAPATAPRKRSRWRALWPAVVGAISALALGLGLFGEAGAVPTVAAAAAFGTRPPLAPVKEPREGQAVLPRVRVAGLPFPYWEDGFGWRAVGLRRDGLDGRVVTTVFYERNRHLIGYSIVPGPPLPLGSRADRTVRDHSVLRSFSVDRRLVVTWQRRGHTCVLTGPRTSASTLLRLAAWRAGGRLPY